MRVSTSSQRGETLVEVLLATAMFALIGFAVVLLVAGSFQAALAGGTRSQAEGYARESLEAVSAIGRTAYNQLASGTYGLTHVNGQWAFADTPDVNGIFTRSVRIFDVYRDGSGAIAASGGSLDINTRGITVSVSWPLGGVTKNITQTGYFTNWNSLNAVQSSSGVGGGFGGGLFATTKLNLATATTTPPSTVELTTANSKFWKCAAVENVLDFPGTTQGLGIATYGHYAFMVLKHNSTGEFAVIDKTNPHDLSASPVKTIDIGNKDATALAISSDGRYAYIGTSDGNFMAIDISTLLSASPNYSLIVRTNTLALSNNVQVNKIALYGTNAYLATQAAGGGGSTKGQDFYAINLAAPGSPSDPRSFTTGGKGVAKLNGSTATNAKSLVLSADGKYAFVVTDDVSNRLIVVDVSQPDTPKTVKGMNLTNISSSAVPTDIAIYQTNLYIVSSNSAGSSGEFFEVNVASSTNPYQPTFPSSNGSINLGNGALSVSAEGTNALIGTQTANKNTLQVVDTAPIDNDGNPATDQTPVIVLSVSLSKFSYNSLFWDATDKLLYAATSDQNAELQIVNRSGKINWGCMQQQGIVDAPGNNAGLSVAASGNNLYLGTSKNNSKPEFRVYDVTDPTSWQNPPPPASYDVNASINSIAVSGNFAFLATNDSAAQVQVFNVASSSDPVPAHGGVGSSFSPAGVNSAATAIAVNNGRVLVTIGTTLYEFTFDTNGVLTPVGSMPLAGIASKIIFYNLKYAYVTTASNTQQVQFIEYDTNPVLAGAISLGVNGNGTGLWLKGSWLLVGTDNAGGSDFFVFDISTTTTPVNPIASLNLGSKVTSVSAAPSENFAFAGVNINGQEMKTIDLSPLVNPSSTSTISVSSVENTLNGFINDMYFYNNTIFLATQDNAGEGYIYGEIPGFAGYNTQFATDGTYTEFPPTDAGQNVTWNTITWTYTTSSGCATSTSAAIKMQVRSAVDSGSFTSSLPFTGPATTSPSSFYTNASGSLLSSDHTGHRYIQYQATLVSDASCTPFLTNVTFNYTL